MALIIVQSILGILTLMIVMATYGRTHRSMELQSSLPSAVEETLANMMLTNSYSIANKDELLADLTSELSVLFDSTSDITVSVIQCNTEKGILTVRVTVSYTHPNGRPGQVSCERNVIFNKLIDPEPINYYLVDFVVGDKSYKRYSIEEGKTIKTPAVPQRIGGTFYGWVDENGSELDESAPITQDVVYYADIR